MAVARAASATPAARAASASARRARRAARLREQRAAGRRLLVVERDARAGRRLGDRARRRQPGRPAAHDADVERLVARRQPDRRRRVGQRPRAAHLAHELEEQRVAGAAAGHHRVVIHALGEQPVGRGEHVDVGAGEGVLARAAELGARRRQAGALVGAAVDAQEAGRAVAVETEEAARPVVLRRARQRLDPGGVQGDGDRLALEGGDALALEVDGDGEAARGAGKERSRRSGDTCLIYQPTTTRRRYMRPRGDPNDQSILTHRRCRHDAHRRHQPIGCGYILHPERRGIQAGTIDTATMVMDFLWLLAGIVPGVVALVVDFSSGGIYASGRRAELRLAPEGHLAFQVPHAARPGRVELRLVTASHEVLARRTALVGPGHGRARRSISRSRRPRGSR